MQMTIGQALDKIDAMRIIVQNIRQGIPVDRHMMDIAEFLDEYLLILSNTKVNI